jgi:hypothetical protein
MGSEAKKILEEVISNVLNTPNGVLSPREKLDSSVHILDLSKKHVLFANRIDLDKNSTDSYNRFIHTVEQLAHTSTSIDDAIEKVLSNQGTHYIAKFKLLVCKNFRTARIFITQVSRAIPDDEYFGTSYRERSFAELKTAYGIEEGSPLIKDFLNKAFVIEGNRIGQVQEFIQGNKSTYHLVPIYSSINSQFLALKSQTGEISIEPASQHMGARISTEKGTIQLVNTDMGLLPLLKRQYLSKLDLGHLFKKKTLGGDTPLGKRLQDSLSYIGLSPEAKGIVQHYINKLDAAHGSVKYIFHNQAARGSLTETSKKVGFVVLTVQYYKVNNNLAVTEGGIKRDILKKLNKMVPTLPGSNTIIEDITEKIINSVTVALGGKAKPLKPHSPVTGSVPILIKQKVKISNQSVTGASKTKETSTTKTKLPIIETSTSYSLSSLQNLLDAHLQDVVSANMGDGSRTDILNYRTGRFAASAKVERLSESREGMITAFYSYMKNPYATFSEGGRQSRPKSRDPKLLISKSIKEIAAEKVANRMKAILV